METDLINHSIPHWHFEGYLAIQLLISIEPALLMSSKSNIFNKHELALFQNLNLPGLGEKRWGSLPAKGNLLKLKCLMSKFVLQVFAGIAVYQAIALGATWDACFRFEAVSKIYKIWRISSSAKFPNIHPLQESHESLVSRDALPHWLAHTQSPWTAWSRGRLRRTA